MFIETFKQYVCLYGRTMQCWYNTTVIFVSAIALFVNMWYYKYVINILFYFGEIYCIRFLNLMLENLV